MLSFDSPEKFLQPFKLAISVNGKEITGVQFGFYDPGHPQRIFLLGPWRINDLVEITLSGENIHYQGSISVPLTFEPTPTSGPKGNNGGGGDTSGGAVSGGPTIGGSVGNE